VDPYAESKPPKTTAKASKVDVEAAYRAGLQQFARGDTTGALASLRTSLAGNPNYAPTWRALGLVFEKLGEKDQARAAYKRYLQLAPSAGDAGQIRSRLERLK
jgi:Tfp pilus assembly protein PilF